MYVFCMYIDDCMDVRFADANWKVKSIAAGSHGVSMHLGMGREYILFFWTYGGNSRL